MKAEFDVDKATMEAGGLICGAVNPILCYNEWYGNYYNCGIDLYQMICVKKVEI